MNETSALRILFIVNPGSGTGAVNWEMEIENYFKPLPHRTELFSLGKNDAAYLPDRLKNKKYDRVVAVGGDGTVTLVARQLLGTEMALGILPAGSANGMAKELNIPATPKEALDIIVNGQVKNSDVLRINEKDICVHLSDIGLNAQLIKYFDEGKLRGKWGYARVILKTLWHRQSMEVIIESKNVQVRREAYMVILANASKYGSGTVINPKGDLHDGLFEVVIIKKVSLLRLFTMLIHPRPYSSSKIESFHAKSVQIDTKHRVPFQVDGEYKGKINHIDAHILPAQLKLVLPA